MFDSIVVFSNVTNNLVICMFSKTMLQNNRIALSATNVSNETKNFDQSYNVHHLHPCKYSVIFKSLHWACLAVYTADSYKCYSLSPATVTVLIVCPLLQLAEFWHHFLMSLQHCRADTMIIWKLQWNPHSSSFIRMTDWLSLHLLAHSTKTTTHMWNIKLIIVVYSACFLL